MKNIFNTFHLCILISFLISTQSAPLKTSFLQVTDSDISNAGKIENDLLSQNNSNPLDNVDDSIESSPGYVVTNPNENSNPATEEQKAEPTSEENKTETAAEEKKTEPATEEKKIEPVTEEKKTEPATEEKKAEPATEEKKTEPATEEKTTTEEKKTEPATEEKTTTEEKKTEPATEEKTTTEEKKTEPVAEEKKTSSVQAVPNTTAVSRKSSDFKVQNIHEPYSESNDTLTESIAVLIIIFTITLLVRWFFSSFKDRKNNFLFHGFANISNQSYPYIFCLMIVFSIYSLGLLDSIKINWESLLFYCLGVMICWIVLNSILLFVSHFVVKRWHYCEDNSVNFEQLKRIYDKFNEEAIPMNQKESKLLPLYEFYNWLALKACFVTPFYPVFKASILSENFSFAYYLELSHLKTHRLLVKLTFTCLIAFTLVACFWFCVIRSSDVAFNFAFYSLIPLLFIAFDLAFLFYLKNRHINGSILVDGSNRINFKGRIPTNQKKPILDMPAYFSTFIDDLEKNYKPGMNFTSLYHARSPSVYESTFIFGPSGLRFILNSTQVSFALNLVSTIVFFVEFCSGVTKEHGNNILYFLIPLFVVYHLVHIYIIAIKLKYFTLCDSVN